ncbi:MAG: FadR family transcriptional regulator [Lachnospiraceae bacterium]|nr:FadR family transcriptional regulator [Lachnospiraceae bacterium]
MSTFDKLTAPSLSNAATQALLSKILSGELNIGDWLPAERDLAEQMGISRSTLHQAVLDLEGKGFLSIIPRRGTMVRDYRKNPTPLSLDTLMRYGSIQLERSLFYDMMDTRLMLESECARCACTHIYESTAQEMQSLIDEMTVDNPSKAEAVYQFHYKLTQASGNSVYSMIFRGFETVLLNLIHKHYDQLPQDIVTAAAQHQLLLEAILAKDEAAAVTHVRDIISQGICVVEAPYESSPPIIYP